MTSDKQKHRIRRTSGDGRTRHWSLVTRHFFLPLLAAVAVALTGLAGAAQEAVETGIIVGQVPLPEDIGDGVVIQAILMSPQWTAIWNGAVQQRIDNYFAANIAAVNENRALFAQISARAQRVAIEVVMARMQVSLGDQFSESVRDVNSDGGFEFGPVPFGDYRIIVAGRIDEVNRIWSGAVTVRSSVPEFIEIRDRIQ